MLRGAGDEETQRVLLRRLRSVTTPVVYSTQRRLVSQPGVL